MWLLIREASAARNLHELLPLVQEFGPHRIAFCTDDREPEHIAEDGHVNSMVREAVAAGIPPEDALVISSLNAAIWHGLERARRDRAGLPGRRPRPARPRALRARARAQVAGGQSARSRGPRFPNG